jgi:hypothetical protein
LQGGPPTGDDLSVSASVAEPVIYREEVLAILIAMSDIVVELRNISDILGGDDEEEED